MGKIHPHGDARRYTYNRCRCADCRAAHTEAHRRRRRAIAYGRWEGMLDATGTIRRIRALAAAGWSLAYLAGRRGTRPNVVEHVANGRSSQVFASVARDYALLYDELCTHDGPSARARTWAAKKGWHGPEAWTDTTIDDPSAQPLTAAVVDDVLVQRAVDGNHQAVAALNPAERVEATRRLVRRGQGVSAVSRHLRVSGTTAQRLVAKATEGVAA